MFLEIIKRAFSSGFDVFFEELMSVKDKELYKAEMFKFADLYDYGNDIALRKICAEINTENCAENFKIKDSFMLFCIAGVSDIGTFMKSL